MGEASYKDSHLGLPILMISIIASPHWKAEIAGRDTDGAIKGMIATFQVLSE